MHVKNIYRMRPMIAMPVLLHIVPGAPESVSFNHREFQCGTIKNYKFVIRKKLVLKNSYASPINYVQFVQRTNRQPVKATYTDALSFSTFHFVLIRFPSFQCFHLATDYYFH